MRIILFDELRPAKGIPYSRSHLKRLIDAKQFPAPVQLGAGGRIGWLDSELDDYLLARAAERGKVA